MGGYKKFVKVSEDNKNTVAQIYGWPSAMALEADAEFDSLVGLWASLLVNEVPRNVEDLPQRKINVLWVDESGPYSQELWALVDEDSGLAWVDEETVEEELP